MRINGYNSSFYTQQTQIPATVEVEGKEMLRETAGEQTAVNLEAAGVIVEISTMQPEGKPQEREPEQKQDLLAQISRQAEKDWKRLCAWVKEMLEKGKELVEKARRAIKSLSEETEDMTSKVGDPSLVEGKRVESGVVPLTWQESFKQKVKMIFDMVNGFLAKHLPMNNGGFSGTKEEEGEELPENRESEGERETNARRTGPETPGSTFDQRG